MRPTAAAGLIAALFVAVLLAQGCGRKMWPEPRADEDRFTITRTTAALNGPCLTVEAELAGAFGNVGEVSIQVQKAGEGGGCPDCPFSPDRIFDFTKGETGLTLMGNYVRASTCALEPKVPYMWRLAVKNRLPGLSPAMSPVGLAEPAQGE